MPPSKQAMTRAQLSRIELQGFRSFGNVRQFLEPAISVSALRGGNSQGKTSFVEALEFLFTGQIARRELLASTKDEFAQALRNAHIAPTHPVWVAATVRRFSVPPSRTGRIGCSGSAVMGGRLPSTARSP